MMTKFLRWNALLLALCCCLTAFALAEEEPVVITTSVDTLTVAVGRIVDYELSISPRSAKKAIPLPSATRPWRRCCGMDG